MYKNSLIRFRKVKTLNEGIFNKFKSYLGNLGSIARAEGRDNIASNELVKRIQIHKQEISQEIINYILDLAKLFELDKTHRISIVDRSFQNINSMYQILRAEHPEFVSNLLPLRNAVNELLGGVHRPVPVQSAKELETEVLPPEPSRIGWPNQPKQLPLGKGPIITPAPKFTKKGAIARPPAIRDRRSGRFVRAESAKSLKKNKKLLFENLNKFKK